RGRAAPSKAWCCSSSRCAGAGKGPAPQSHKTWPLKAALGIAIEQGCSVDLRHSPASRGEHRVSSCRVPLAGRADARIKVRLALGDQTEFERGGEGTALDHVVARQKPLGRTIEMRLARQCHQCVWIGGSAM